MERLSTWEVAKHSRSYESAIVSCDSSAFLVLNNLTRATITRLRLDYLSRYLRAFSTFRVHPELDGRTLDIK